MSKLKQEPIIWYIRLKTFWENKKERWRQTTLSRYILMIKNINPNFSYAEVLQTDYVIPYFDIDYLDSKYKIDNIVERLEKAFLNYFRCNADTLVATITKNKSKEAYHIFFKGPKYKYYVRKKDLKKFVEDFNSHFKHDNKTSGTMEEEELFDTLVYGSAQIFRSVNQPKPGLRKKLEGPETIHEIIKGKLEDTIIQNFSFSRDIPIKPIISIE